MNAKCEYCEKPFNRTRKDQRFCSSNCRGQASIMRGLTDLGSGKALAPALSTSNSGDEFKEYLKQENADLKGKLGVAQTEISTLRLENDNLKRDKKIDEKLAELDAARSSAEKDRGLSGVLDTVEKSTWLQSFLEDARDMLLSKGEGSDMLAGLEGDHKEHLETLINTLRTDPEFTKLVTAIALKCKKDSSVLKEFVHYLNNPELFNSPGEVAEEKPEENTAHDAGIGGLVNMYMNT